MFLDHTRVPQGNTIAELSLWVAVMLTVLRTLAKNGVDAQAWLLSWLTACVEYSQAPPEDLSPWLPWSMGADRLWDFTVSS